MKCFFSKNVWFKKYLSILFYYNKPCILKKNWFGFRDIGFPVDRAGIGGAGSNGVLCKTCSVLLCLLEQPRVDNSSLETPVWDPKSRAQFGTIGPVGLRPALLPTAVYIR